jgi:dUTP pyrophosphatase
MSCSVPLYVALLKQAATMPRRATDGSAGYDLAAAVPVVVPAKGRALVPTGLKITVPPGTYGRIAPRSGLAVKHGITTGAGVIDPDYKGEVKVVLFNLSETHFVIIPGDRIAQLILERVETPEVVQCSPSDDEEEETTARGSKGFGSTGVSTTGTRT